jgi:hypothetical protein
MEILFILCQKVTQNFLIGIDAEEAQKMAHFMERNTSVPTFQDA